MTFNTTEATTEEFTYSDLTYTLAIPHIRAIFITCYVIVFICCFFGNLLVILVILVHRKMRTITNFFLANLAVADFCVGIFCVFPNMAYNLNPLSWVLGRVMCKLQNYIQSASYTASIAILTVISIERYFAIIHPMKSKKITTLCMLRTVIIAIWIMAAIYGSLYLFISETVPVFEMETTCRILAEKINMPAYLLVNFILWYVIPLMLMIVMYTRISVVLWKTSKPDSLTRNTVSAGGAAVQSRAFLKPTKKGKLVSFNKTVVKIDEKAAYEPMGLANNANISSDEAYNGKKVSIDRKSNNEHDKLSYENDFSSSKNEDSKDGSDESLSGIPNDYENDWPTSRRKCPDEIKLYVTKPPTTDSDSTAEKHGSTHAGRIAVTVPAFNRMTRLAATQKVQTRRGNALTARRKVIRLLIAIIFSFAACVLPYHINTLIRNVWGYNSMSFSGQLVTPITMIILYFQSGLNPILYAFLSENFRKSLREVLYCQHRQTHQRSARSTTSGKTVNSTL